MDYKFFRDEVERKLIELEFKQLTAFAWRCGVRALPFLGSSGHFNYWLEDGQGIYLYKVLRALDAAVYQINPTDAGDAAIAAVHANQVVKSTDPSNIPAAIAARAAARTAARAARAASAVSSANNSHNWNLLNTTTRFDVASAARNAHKAAHVLNLADPFSTLILSDIEQLKSGKTTKGDISIYGDVWPNFMKALESIGCTYWGHLYKEIIESGFQVNEKDLQRRSNVSIEIQDQGAAPVAKYLEKLEREGARRLNEARVIILGDKGSGKTCIARRLINPEAPMTRSEESTSGVETSVWALDKENIKVRIWDFAGHTVTHAVHRFFLSERCLYIIVLNGRNGTKNLEYWLDHTSNYGGDSQVLILINRRDRHKVKIPINTIKNKYKGVIGIYDFSVDDDAAGLESFRADIRTLIANNPSWTQQEIPESYYKVKEELEAIFVKGDRENGEEYIDEKRFHAIAEECGVSDREELLRDLHHLGVSLWYEGLKDFKTLILNPEWISHGVYQIINWLSNKDKFHLRTDDYLKIFKSNAARYPEGKHPFLSKLMMHYELAYETNEQKALIVPHLLNEDQPSWLPEFSPWTDLLLRYESLQPLPPNVVSRFIVRHSEEIKPRYRKELVWRYGVVLQDADGNEALVLEEDRVITVSVKGKSKAEYLSRIRETLNKIFNSYKVQKPELQYRVRRMGHLSDPFEKDNPLLVPEEEIIRHHQHNRPIYDSATNRDIPPAEVIHQYQINAKSVSFRHGDDIRDDHSTHNTFNFKDCNVSLQGNLNALARKLAKVDEEEAEEVKDVVEALNEAKACESPEAAKEKGLDKTLGRWMKDLADENSNLHKTVKGIKRGAGIAQDIAAEYNKLAQWLALPQVPKPFLKKSDS